MSKEFVTRLSNRGAVQVQGPDAKEFLQGLITNDMGLLDTQSMIYACLLSPQGKFQHDFFIHKSDKDTFFIDCEGCERAQNLAKRLTLFKLRSDVTIECMSDINVIAGNTDKPESAITDPRLEELGWRDYSDSLRAENDEENYHTNRVKLGVPDGSKDMVPDKSTIIESWLHKLNAVSFKKGCYMGQELVARMYYRGLAKKHLYPIKVESDFTNGDNIKTSDGKLAGEMRSLYGQHGLALIKDKLFDSLSEQGPVKPHRAKWMKDP